jgi:Fe2+ or Zn2+ uptake regulation protein
MNHTEQRTMIMKELMRAHSHVTAEELYATLKVKLPQLSLGTVYRNLNNLYTHGYVNKLIHGKNKAYFEWGKDPNSLHVTCPKCGKITHFMSQEINTLLKSIQTISGKDGCESIQFELIKTCEECKRKHEEQLQAAKAAAEAKKAKILTWTGSKLVS